MTSSDRWVSVSTDYVKPRLSGERDAWSDEAARAGRTGSQVLTEVGQVEPPDDVAHALGLSPGEMAVVRRRLVLLDQQPIEIADSYYPISIAGGSALAEQQKIRGGAVTLLAEMGHMPRQIREDVSARMPNAAERAVLKLGGNQPVLVLFRITVGDDGLPIEVSVMVMADDRHLRYELTV